MKCIIRLFLCRFDALLRDLETYFSEAIKIPPSVPLISTTLPSPGSAQNIPKRSYSRDSDDESSVNNEDLTRRSSAAARMTDGSKEIEMRASVSKPNLTSRKFLPSFVNGKQLTTRLAYVSMSVIRYSHKHVLTFAFLLYRLYWMIYWFVMTVQSSS